MPVEKITRAEARDALLRSGYLLESRVEALLQDRDYYVEANSVYPDPLTGKAREFDIDALTIVEITKNRGEYLFVNVLIECVNNPRPLTLITKDPILPELHTQAVKVVGAPLQVLSGRKREEWTGLTAYLRMEDYHHYCQGRIATQYCSFTPKKGVGKQTEWLASHDEEHFDGFRKLAAVVDYQLEQQFESVRDELDEMYLEFKYLVLVVQGELWDARPTKRSVELRKADRMQFKYSTMADGSERVYHVDVVTERHLPELLSVIENEMERTASLMRARRRTLVKSVNVLVERLKKARSPKERRAILETSRLPLHARPASDGETHNA